MHIPVWHFSFTVGTISFNSSFNVSFFGLFQPLTMCLSCLLVIDPLDLGFTVVGGVRPAIMLTIGSFQPE